ncbi:MAG: SpoIIE family protein phosphatase [Ruminococcus sp.]|nr:SpoIIE family protein phosphatase [Ruminococcus sp.]
MKKLFGLKIGGLQQKILNLVLVFVLAIVGAFMVTCIYLSKNLTKVVEDSSDKQKGSMTEISEKTISAVLELSLTKSNKMEADIANGIFTVAKGDVQTLQEYAEYIFTHSDEFTDKAVSYPKKENDGKPSVQLQHEKGLDPANDRYLGLAGNMSEIMLSMYKNSSILNSCFIATADGSIIFVDDRSGAYFDDKGNVVSFDTRSRPWYTGAVEKKGIYFTGVELDASTDIPGLVCSAPVYVDGKLVAVVGADVFLYQISDFMKNSAKSGSINCILNENGELIFSSLDEGTFKTSTSDQAVDLREHENKELAAFVAKALKESTGLTSLTLQGREYYVCATPMDSVGWTVASAVDKEMTDAPTKTLIAAYESINDDAQEDYNNRSEKSQRILLIITVAILILAVAAALTLARAVVKPIERMTARIGEFKDSDLTFEMEDTYRTGDEIEVLAESFATLSKRTREYIVQITKITAEKERIGAELELATKIQADMLPNIYPAFPDREEFDIYATMTPAKEVGGDFYDFFLIDDDHLGLVMADVSGKGVPAALFMMMSKILVSNFAMMGGSPAKVLEQVNTQICKNNEEEMFVTVWFGVLEISTGKVTAANAGHEYPIVKKADGSFELFKDKHGFVIGGMEGMRYKDYEFTLEKGSTLFLYTDGVAEATNAANELFGTDRMLAALNAEPEAAPEKLLSNMKKAVDDFVGDAPQFDDLTMLSVKLL